MLAVEASLHLQSDRITLRLDGSGSVLTCHLKSNARTILPALRRTPDGLRALRLLGPLLLRTGLRLDIVAGNRRIACAGSGVTPNLPARIFGLSAVRLGA